MQFIDLKRQYQEIQDSVQKRINTVLNHGGFILGPEIADLERVLAEYTGARYCITCASGTDALLLPLMALGVGPGDAVFTTPFTFIATAEVIALLGATPVFVDIDPQTYNIDPEKLREAIRLLTEGKQPTAKTPAGLKPRGIIAVDIFGLPADYDTLRPVAKEHGLKVLEEVSRAKRPVRIWRTLPRQASFPQNPSAATATAGRFSQTIRRW
jgi:dTDP-4-amino-4,6-dideoxygalactose transaminase